MADVAVITGGASGIGRACAGRLAGQGAEVWILDQNAAAAEEVARDLGGTALALDVSDAKAVEAAAARIGVPTMLVTAAGVIETVSTVLDADLEAHDRLWAINYGGTLNACRSFGRLMQGAGAGGIVTVGSINSFAALPLPAYCPSKTAILRLVQMLAVELGRAGVRVNGVAPTYVLTPVIQAKVDTGERSLDAMLAVNALGQMVEPRDIADAVAFLLSPQARAITGHMLPVDAGHLPMASFETFAGGLPWD